MLLVHDNGQLKFLFEAVKTKQGLAWSSIFFSHLCRRFRFPSCGLRIIVPYYSWFCVSSMITVQGKGWFCVSLRGSWVLGSFVSCFCLLFRRFDLTDHKRQLFVSWIMYFTDGLLTASEDCTRQSHYPNRQTVTDCWHSRGAVISGIKTLYNELVCPKPWSANYNRFVY